MSWLRIAGCGVLCIGLIAGCYPMSTTRQDMFVQVYKKDKVECLPGAVILLKQPRLGSDDEEYINTPPAYCAITDAKGVGKVRIEKIDHELWPFKAPDRVTGNEYICKVLYDSSQDVFRIIANAGSGGAGEQFSTSVISISRPEYVDVK